MNFQAQTTWNLEHNLLIYNLLTHLKNGFYIQHPNLDDIWNNTHTYCRHIANKLKQEKIPHQLLILEDGKKDICVFLDCGGSLWNTLGKGVETMLNFIPVHKEQKFTLRKWTTEDEDRKLLPISLDSPNYQPIFKEEAALFYPIAWDKVSFLKFQHKKPSEEFIKEPIFLITNEHGEQKLHEIDFLQDTPLNDFLQKSVEKSSLTSLDELKVTLKETKELNEITQNELQTSLSKTIANAQKIKKQLQKHFDMEYEKSNIIEVQKWAHYSYDLAQHIAENINSLFIENKDNQFLMQNIKNDNYQRLELNLNSEDNQKILIDLLNLCLITSETILLKREVMFNIYRTEFDTLPILSSFLIHSQKQPYIYAYSNPTWRNVLAHSKDTIIYHSDDDFYSLDQHPFFKDFEPYLIEKHIERKLKVKQNPVNKLKRF